MSFLGIHIMSDDAFKALKTAGHAVESFAVSEAQKAVIALKQTEIGQAVANDIAAVASHDMTGAEKFEAVVSNTLPLVVKLLHGGGIKALEHEVADIARGLVQSVFNDFKSTSAGKIAGEILKLLGVG